MIARRLATIAARLGLAASACGDNLHREDVNLTIAVSGSRLALQKYRYDDGTEQTAATELYDTVLHVRCVPAVWIDGAVRCVPNVDTATYVDPACTSLVGIAQMNAQPSYFLAYDSTPGGEVPARLFRAGAATAAITGSYRIASGVCTGPFPLQFPPGSMSFFEVGGELDGTTLIEIHGDEIGDGRLGLQIQRGDDGVRLVSGLRDRQLDLGCAPQAQSDGSVVCAPVGAPPASFFADPGCAEPVAAVAQTPTAPAIATMVEPSGCASYRRVGRPVSPPIYRRDGSVCIPVAAPAGSALFAVADPIELPVLGRSLENAAGHRLQHIVLAHDELRFFDPRLLDTATGVECGPRTIRSTIRCLPANLPALVLFAAGCTMPVPVAEVPQRACSPFAFATTGRPFQIRSIEAPVSGGMFRLDNGACTPYAPAAGMELHALGPPVDLTTFLGGVYFSERDL
jgi:hypothetical protein